MRRARGILLATAAAALLAPASAHAALGWYDAGAGVPGSVELKSVTRFGSDTVIAVGTDTAANPSEPAIYRFDGTSWWRDTLDDTTVKGQLLDVAANADGAWAVGVRGDGTTPLLVQLPPTPATQPIVDDPLGTIPPPAAKAWKVLTATGGKALRTVSLNGAGGYAGDAGGSLWKISAAGTVGEVSPPDSVAGTPHTRGFNGVALTGADTGYAVADGGLAEDRIFQLKDAQTLTGEVAVPDTVGSSILSVAVGDGQAMAVDAGGYWQPTAGGPWQRDTAGLGTGTVRLSDVSIAKDLIAVGGQVGSDGYVWRRTPAGWSRLKAASTPINGVYAYGSADVWAVGGGGTLVHYYDKPPVPPTTCTADCGGSGGTTGGGTTSGDSGYTYGPTTTTSGNTQTTEIPPERKGDPTIFIVEPKQPATKRGTPRRLLDRVKVRRRAKRLIVTFRLRARARVAIAAKRGHRVVSRSSRAMRPGRRRVVLPFKGSPPNQLRIVVRPLRAKRAR